MDIWIIHAIWIHIVLLGSIFVIYFRSPVITNLVPQNVLKLEPAANRLVLIVTDGLRAESFFRKNCSDIPHIRELILHQNGLVGISQTHVPTESRPGHIALIAGLYEDPSAVTRGWKENPIDFDTLFNRSKKTFGWGANDVLHIFARISGAGEHLFLDAYDHDLDFSGSDKTYKLDEWVFERVHLFLRRRGEDLKHEKQLVFFLHLLGLDTAGHIHKPGTELFLENLQHTEHGIWKIYKHFEETFTDGKTVYLMTADHGMTNSGSHGAGDPLETETPFFLWGAGVGNIPVESGESFQAGLHNTLPLHKLEQAQFAPIMSTLLGLPPPMNNFGILPQRLLNVSLEYEAHAAHTNAMQLLEQYKKLLLENQRGYFSKFLNSYAKLDMNIINTYIHLTETRIKTEDYMAAINASQLVMKDAIEGIEYYHNYYENVLLLTTTLTFIGWMFYLVEVLRQRHIPLGERITTESSTKISYTPFLILIIILIGFFILQRVPITLSFYIALPIPVWALTYMQKNSKYSKKRIPLKNLHLVPLIGCAELLIWTFFERRILSVLFLIYTYLYDIRHSNVLHVKYIFRGLLIVILVMVPLLPPTVGYKNFTMLFIGMICIIARAYLVKSNLSKWNKSYAVIALVNALVCIYQHSNQIPITFLSQFISWSYLFYSFMAIVLDKNSNYKQRVNFIFFQMSTLYALFCTTYELVFIIALGTELMMSISAHPLISPIMQPTLNSPMQLELVLRLSFAIILYTFYSFFGTGNIASISSFDPIIIRCFLKTFSPFIITTLVIIKLLIPVIIVMTIIFGVSRIARYYEHQIFICLLLICDVMGLNCLFLIQNKGSWKEIGTSISHFVIVEVTTLVLLVLTVFVKFLLGIRKTNLYDLKGS